MLAMLFKSFLLIMLGCISQDISAIYNIDEPIVATIGIEDANNSPFYNIDEHGEFNGLYRRIFDRFAAESNIKFIYKTYKIDQLFEKLYTHEIDLKFPDNPIWRTADKLKYLVIYSDPLCFYIEALFVKPHNINKNIDDIQNIGSISKVTLWSVYNYIAQDRIKVTLDSCPQLIQQVLTNQLDGILCNYFVMKHSLAQLKLDNLLVPNFNLPHIDDSYYLSTISAVRVLERFNAWIKKYKNEINNCHLNYSNNAKHPCIFN